MFLDAHIAQRFSSRNIHFYHAENLENFRSYCAARKLLCRGELINRNPEKFTAFYSDESDLKLGVLGRVFGNLTDFGDIYQRARKSTPNVYGPIQLVFNTQVFGSMNDICITPLSIATLKSQWRNKALSSEDAINALLEVDKPSIQINSNFSFCELSCENKSIPFDFLEYVIVEPLQVLGSSLNEIVEGVLREYGIHVPVTTRTYDRAENQSRLQQLADICHRLGPPKSRDALPLPANSLPIGFQDLEHVKKKRLLLWCRYFTHGTITPLMADAKIDWLDDNEDYTICELCEPGDERPPPKVSYSPIRGGQSNELLLGDGRCDWCGGVSIRCQSCGTVHPISDQKYDKPIECEGGCGLRFEVRQDEDGFDRVNVLLSADEEKMLHGYQDEDEFSHWWDDE